jgi:hypothetical protein
MTWLTWRLFRLQAVPVYALLAVLALALAVVSLPQTVPGRLIDELASGGAATTLYTVGILSMLALPAIIGIFWGAPLVARELEAGTHRLAWSQTVSRTRWLATKLAVVGLAAILGTAIVTLLVTWWCAPIDEALNAGQSARNGPLQLPRMDPLIFPARGIAPIGYTAFAFMLGVAVGTLVRRTVPAMAITLAVFIAVQVAMPQVVRPQLFASELVTKITAENMRGLNAGFGPGGEVFERVNSLTIDPGKPGAWAPINETIDRNGNAVEFLPDWVASCVPMGEAGPPPGSVPRPPRKAGRFDENCFTRLATEGYRQRVIYHAAGRYWTLQALETAIFLALAGLLAGGTFWWVRRRLT